MTFSKLIKCIFLFFLLTEAINSLADSFQKQVTLVWQNPSSVILPDSSVRKALKFQGAVYYAGTSPVWNLTIDNQEVNKVILSNPQYLPLTPEEKDIFHIADLSQSNISFKTLWQRNKPVSFIDIIPIAYDSLRNEVVKLTSFTLHYQTTTKRALSTKRKTTEKTNSVLASGTWIKIGVTENGIYKIDFDFLKRAGLNPAAIDPRKIKIYGNGGKMLPQKNSDFRHADLVENGILVAGESDGVFNSNDYILFYGQSPDTYEFDPDTNDYVYRKNFYSDTSYYFLNISQENGLRVANQASTGNNHPLISSFDDHYIYEKDLVNFLTLNFRNTRFGGSGREWYGDQFNPGMTRTYKVELPGIIPNRNLKITSATMASSLGSSNLEIKINNQQVGVQNFTALINATYSSKGVDRLDQFEFLYNGGNALDVSYSFNGSNFSDLETRAFLNYFIINYQRNLRLYGSWTFFRSIKSLENDNSTFEVENSDQNTVIWDISDPFTPKNQIYSLDNSKAIFGSATNHLKEFVVFRHQNLPAPVLLGQINNQNLRGEPVPDMVIVSHPLFLSEAKRLADFRRSKDGMDVLVTTPQKIYNEFSSGSQDVSAIRDFMKHLYDKNPSKIKYLLLFGKCSFDYKNRVNNNSNFVPIYQSRNSLHPISSYSSDDYYGFLDDEEGEWIESHAGDHLLDIGIGRLPVITREEAGIVVNKIIHYSTTKNRFGSWKNLITFVAEDGDANTHQRDADRLATFIDTTFIRYNINKIYVDAYPQIQLASGDFSAPKVNEAIDDAIRKGTLIMNYTGHGNERRWAKQGILNNTMIGSWTNIDKLPLIVTATCDYGRFDTPSSRSGGEFLIITRAGGAIGLITSARAVISNTNYLLNLAFYNSVFFKEGSRYKKMGQVFMETKNNSLNGSVNRNFSYLGDPSLTLAFPEEEVVITAINDKTEDLKDTIGAFDKVWIKGHIQDLEGNKLDYRGILEATVFDKSTTIETFGVSGPSMSFQLRNSILFRGRASVSNGDFEVEFIVPKNIDYKKGKGKISLYSYSEEMDRDAGGAFISFVIGGSENNDFQDNKGPEINLYLDNTQFISGNIVNSNPLLLAHLFDESGINLTSRGIGQEIVATLNGSDKLILNDYYQTELDTYEKGFVIYPFKDLDPGYHTLSLKAWDINNNSGEASIDFIVAENEGIVIRQLLNTPNPFNVKTNFHIEHNREGQTIEVRIDIYSSKGELVKTIEGTAFQSEHKITNLEWDGTGNNNSPLKNGIYIYKVHVKSQRDGSFNHKSSKVVLLK